MHACVMGMNSSHLSTAMAECMIAYVEWMKQYIIIIIEDRGTRSAIAVGLLAF